MTLDVEECPENFHELGKRKDLGLDFENMPDAELLEMDGDVEALKAHLEVNYPEVTFANNIGWATLVARYIEARYNRVTKVDNTGKVKNTIVSVNRQLDEAEQVEEEERVHPDEDNFDDIDDLLKGE